MQNYFEKQFELRYFEMNKFGEASPTTMLTLLEETAAEHCFSIDYSLYDLVKQNIGWVLFSGIIKMERYPAYKEKITIRTWLSNYSTVRGHRENIIYDEQHNIIGRARGLWVFFDIAKRRPIRIFDEIKDQWLSCDEKCINHNITKQIEAISSEKYTNKFTIKKFDTDTNGHVNNIRYLQWVIETIPDEIVDNYYLHSIEGRFIAEAKYGDTVKSITQNDIYDNSFIHSINTIGNNQVCASAKTTWKQRI